MIEVRELKKVYKTKGGVPVNALNGVSIKFPETGMVFLLGKSGSGKSTLLNVTGGLDKPDSGEIIVKGRSSKDFTASDFDSYRNTFIGFIFQEYNVLNEFTIEQNIALALQLQGKPNDKKAVEELLDLVDLSGLGKRKPNTLSGGQKQRVAIARALIKSPEIIMADEPTGALDSKTGKQVLDTLKKLSKDKLVIVVSHDREFAKTYADRIIELKDGEVFSDRTREFSEIVESQTNVTVLDNSVTIKKGVDLTDEEIAGIVNTLKSNKGEVVITTGSKQIPLVKKACNIETGSIKDGFTKTKEVKTKEYDGKETKFIKSRLPVSHAFKIGVSSMKVKPVRLAFTILLSVIAFVLFGVLSTMMMYNPIYSISESLIGSPYNSIMLTKTYETTKNYYTIDEEGNISPTIAYSEELPIYSTLFGQEEIDKLNNNDLGLEFIGIFTCGNKAHTTDSIIDYQANTGLNVSLQEKDLKIPKKLQHYYTVKALSGFTDCGPEYMENRGYKLHGRYPEGKNEIAIPEYIFRLLLENDGGWNPQTKVDDYTQYYNRIIGQKIKFDERIQEIEVVGIYEMPLPEKYSALKIDVSLSNLTDEIKALREEWASVLKDSFNTIGFVSEAFYEEYNHAYNTMPIDYRFGLATHLEKEKIPSEINDAHVTYTYTNVDVARYPNNFIFFDNNGVETEFKLGEKEVYLSASDILTSNYFNRFLDRLDVKSPTLPLEKQLEFAKFKDAVQNFRDVDKSYHGDDVRLILKTFLSEYENIVEEPMPDYSTLYFKSLNAQDKVESAKVVGFYFSRNSKFSNCKIFDYDYLSKFSMGSEEKARYSMKSDGVTTVSYYSDYATDYVVPENAKYERLLTATDNTKEQTYFMLENPPEFTKYHMTNRMYQYAEEMSDQVKDLSVIFLGAGLAAGILASLMFLNFISVSIAAKRKEIGVLRAVGARGSDVFKIFFAEALVIVLICFVIASIAAGYVCTIINGIMMTSDIMIKLFDYNVWSVLIVFAVSMIVALIATYVPVRSATKKPPVESIREL